MKLLLTSIAASLLAWSAAIGTAPAAHAQARSSATGKPASEGALYPLALGTRWTYHQRHELGEGVRFDERDAKQAKGNVLEVELVSEVKGSDVIRGQKYVRVESVKAGRLVLTEWFRLGRGVLLLGRTLDSDTGQQIEMLPPQKLVTTTTKAGESWMWKASDAPVSIRITVVGPAQVSVPAGSFDSTQLLHQMTMDLGHSSIIVRQTRWFAPGVGYVKQEAETRAGDRLVSKVVLTLKKFEASSR